MFWFQNCNTSILLAFWQYGAFHALCEVYLKSTQRAPSITLQASIAHRSSSKIMILNAKFEIGSLVHSLLVGEPFSNANLAHYCLTGRLFGANCLSSVRACTSESSIRALVVRQVATIANTASPCRCRRVGKTASQNHLASSSLDNWPASLKPTSFVLAERSSPLTLKRKNVPL
jgi:hypothetical protein